MSFRLSHSYAKGITMRESLDNTLDSLSAGHLITPVGGLAS